MTREDAIYWLGVLKTHSEKRDAQNITEALNMAIEALTFQQGEWVNKIGRPISDNHSVYCSICGEWSEYRSDFCPNCGAEMAERKTENSSAFPNNCEDEPKIECLEWYDKVGNYHRYPKDEPQTDGILFKGNLKEGDYKLIKTTNGWVLEGDIAYYGEPRTERISE